MRVRTLAQSLIAGLLLATLALAFSPFAGWAAETDERLASDEKMLKDNKIGVEAKDLIEFFKQRTLADDDRIKIGELIKLLGNDDFGIRERATADLIKMGPKGAPLLRQATSHDDAEIAERAKKCLNALPAGGGPDLAAAAARVMIHRKPDGVVEVLLAYLPSAADDYLEEEIASALSVLGVKDGKPDKALAAAANDKLTVRRLAAAATLAKCTGDEYKAAVKKMLTDPEPRIRLFTAINLVRAKDKEAVPALIALLADGPMAMAWQAEDMLFRVAGEGAPQVAVASNAESRKKAKAAWEEWWKKNEKTAKLELNKEEPLKGITLIIEIDGSQGGGRVWACDKDGKKLWEITQNISGPVDAQMLPGGKILISEHHAQRVTERNREDGKILWEKKVNNSPVACQRLTNGNTLIATYNTIMEVDRDGKEVWSHNKGNTIFHAQKLRNGNVLYVDSSGNATEMDVKGGTVRTIKCGNTSSWASIEPLANGRYLVAQYGANKVLEVDASGKTYLDLNATNPCYAQRLPDGNTLIADSGANQVREVNRDGKEKWKQACNGRPFRVRRY